MWTRTARYANVYAFATLDALSVILWLSAWAAVASYVSEGKGKGKHTKGSGCDNFGLGSPAKCKLSEATIFFGVVIMLLFVATSYISFKAVMHYKRTGQMPTSVKPSNDFAAQTQDAFSSNLRTDDFDDEAGGFDARQGGGQHSRLGISKHEDDEYALLHQADNDDLGHPPSNHGALPVPLSYSRAHSSQDYNTSYDGAYGRHSPNSLQEVGYGAPPPTYGK
jgi:translocation protein SEC72